MLMSIIASLILFLSTAALLHTYLIYPAWLLYAARDKHYTHPRYGPEDEWPTVTVLMAVHNEERILADKLESLLIQDYSGAHYRIFIGSDASTDGTNRILNEFAERDSRVRVLLFPDRQGKAGVVNALARHAAINHALGPRHLFLMTDASVILERDTLRKLVRHFKDPELALVDGYQVHTGLQASGISRSEDLYINREVRIKAAESLLWRYMIGPFGGCYVLRSNYFTPIPPNRLVDDFYLCMRAFEKGGRAINDTEARCYEPVGQVIQDEFRRKARISAGNFQNLFTFKHLWWPPADALRFAFFSHKVLRWLGPFFLLGLLLSSGYLALVGRNLLTELLFVMVSAGLILPIPLDYLLQRWGRTWLPLRHLHYFISMNAALLTGFFRYAKGIKTSVWQPSKRY
jgi:cellulose synthase/poly-beta-1,6-N-acetylglucosamine synthase-like glycosyltransferase